MGKHVLADAVFQQELLAVGSLTTIVVAVLRHHLLLDTGVPFGFLGAGVSFTQINWFWSPGFLLSIQSNRRQVFLAATLVTCGILAVAVGPAAAVLLVPVLRVSTVATEADSR